MSQLDVQGGDVLLFRGSSWISRAIRWFDHSEVNHAAIALDGTTLAEATGHGLDKGSIDQAIDHNPRTIQRRRLDSPDGAPLVACAQGYLGDGVPYGYHQIVLLAILASTRRIPLPWVAKRLVRSALDHAADVIGSFLDGDDGTRFMICSEYVYRCYDEASSAVPDPYDVGLDPGGPRPEPAADPGGPATFLQWAVEQPEATAERATVLAEQASATALGTTADVLADAEQDLERLIQEYAVAAAAASPEIAADVADAPTAAAAAPAALGQPEPTPEELLAAHIRLAQALERTREAPDALEPLGIGSDLLKGLVKGLLDVEASPNFVTPGDLHTRAAKLRTIADTAS